MQENTLILGALGLGALYFLSKDGVFKGISDTSAGLGTGAQGLGEGVADASKGIGGGISDVVADTTDVTGAASEEIVDIIHALGDLAEDAVNVPGDSRNWVSDNLKGAWDLLSEYLTRKQKDDQKKTDPVVISRDQAITHLTSTTKMLSNLGLKISPTLTTYTGVVSKPTSKQKTEAKKVDVSNIDTGNWRIDDVGKRWSNALAAYV